MWTVSDLYREILASDNHYFEYSLCFGNTSPDYGIREDGIISISCEYAMFGSEEPTVGGCISADLSASLFLPNFTIPRMEKVRPYVRVSDGVQYSEWIPQGVYFIDTRETTNDDDDRPILTLHCYDAMAKAEADYPSTSHSWPYSDVDVVQEIADTLGVGVDDRTWDLMTNDYQISLPAGYAMREVLSNIGGMYAGNWILNYDGELLLIAVNGIPPETNYLVDGIGDAITFGGDRILV